MDARGCCTGSWLPQQPQRSWGVLLGAGAGLSASSHGGPQAQHPMENPSTQSQKGLRHPFLSRGCTKCPGKKPEPLKTTAGRGPGSTPQPWCSLWAGFTHVTPRQGQGKRTLIVEICRAGTVGKVLSPSPTCGWGGGFARQLPGAWEGAAQILPRGAPGIARGSALAPMGAVGPWQAGSDRTLPRLAPHWFKLSAGP